MFMSFMTDREVPKPPGGKMHATSPEESALNAFFETHDCIFLAEKAKLGTDPGVVERLNDATPAVLVSIFCEQGKDAEYFKREVMELGFSGGEARKLFIALRIIRDEIVVLE
jgi:5,10-methenyltetrahydromethanopterin hydrogenase